MNTKNDLFSKEKSSRPQAVPDDAPLALRMRPENLDEFVGQKHILGEGKLLRRLIDSDKISSLILYGPSGSGKSALGFIISRMTNSFFQSLHAAASGVKEVKQKLLEAKMRRLQTSRRTILFIDEIHRFNKAQQDTLIDDVELGNIILIGATTHNPFFYIVPALISRSSIFEFKPLSADDILVILKRAVQNREHGFGDTLVDVDAESLRYLAGVSDGDARRALNALEIGVLTTEKDKAGVAHFTKKVAAESIQKRIVRYDRDGDFHYDTISAFIKSMRGSDPDAALYWLGKMIYAGEDPRFIARRILICAAEDVGNADPQALVLANATFQAVEVLGMPEGRIPLAQAAVYVACAPKSNAAYMALEKALTAIKDEAEEDVPNHLKDASYKNAEKLGRGEGYKYAHEFEKHYAIKQKYLNKKVKYYQPTNMGYEKKIKAWLEYLQGLEKK